MEFLLFLMVVVALIAAFTARSRAKACEIRMQYLEETLRDRSLRLYEVEEYLRRTTNPAPAAPAPAPATPPYAAAPTMMPPVPVPEVRLPEPVPVPERAPDLAPAAAPDVEALIGSKWLSKLGVLILLIGIALFLGFSLTQMAPAGRVAVGMLTSLSLLGAGIAAERKPEYRMLATALIGGGWAGLYFTTYAMHALDAARLIDSAAVGFVLLLAVAAGMIGHSLRYQSQTVTGLAFFAAYLTIAISPQFSFARLATVPLLAVLLGVAWRYGWQPLAAAGAVYSYFTYSIGLSTGDNYSGITRFGEPVLWLYWAALEAFDLLNLRRREGTYFPVFLFNALGFLLASVLTWPDASFGPPDGLLAAIAAAYLASSLARVRRRLSPAEGEGPLEDRSLLGGFRASITFSAILAAGAIVLRLRAPRVWYALAIEAELLAVAGWWFRSLWLQSLGGVLFVVPLAGLFSEFWRTREPWQIGGRDFKHWTPLALLELALFYGNRLALNGPRPYTFAGSVVLAMLIGGECTADGRPLGYTLAAVALWAAARWRDRLDLRIQAGVHVALGLTCALFERPQWAPAAMLGVPAVIYLTGAWIATRNEAIRFGALLAGGAFAALTFEATLGPEARLLALGALALALWAAGLRAGSQAALGASHLPAVVGFCRWFDSSLPAGIQLAATLPYFAMLYLSARTTDRLTAVLRLVHGTAAVVMVAWYAADHYERSRITMLWALEGGVLMALGFLWNDRFSRLAALGLFVVCLGKLFLVDFRDLDTLSRILSFIVLGVLMIGASWAYTRFRDQIRRYL